eukprot:CAMPEP_0172444936 /NCGR_PEP_ID=MMETSP1065-20121228/4946_1 /TAXON_ID=265537 /ORGANISM="Amphiprora paludosa, Strain CCMP125" /LENGTH=58 /DNA_ID=CAMNT_0013195703 /DNA_START=115 /DNA_END=288 /DNA_ORIENTATION=-
MADNHFDSFRNWIVMMSGIRRIILAPPQECPHMDLHPMDHVRSRHSAHPWSERPDTLK